MVVEEAAVKIATLQLQLSAALTITESTDVF